MREVTLRVRHNGEPECEVSAAYPEVTLRSVSSMTGRDEERKRIIELSGDRDAIPRFLDEFRATDPILAAEPLSPLGKTRVYVAMVYDAEQWDSISERLSDMGIHYRTGTTINAGWERWIIYLGDDDDLGEIIGQLEAAGNDTELVRNVEMSEMTPAEQLDVRQFVRSLTPRQEEALTAAIAGGYYGHDRTTSIDEIAEELGVARTTAWEHLNRAEGKVMAGIGDHLKR